MKQHECTSKSAGVEKIAEGYVKYDIIYKKYKTYNLCNIRIYIWNSEKIENLPRNKKD